MDSLFIVLLWLPLQFQITTGAHISVNADGAPSPLMRSARNPSGAGRTGSVSADGSASHPVHNANAKGSRISAVVSDTGDVEAMVETAEKAMSKQAIMRKAAAAANKAASNTRSDSVWKFLKRLVEPNTATSSSERPPSAQGYVVPFTKPTGHPPPKEHVSSKVSSPPQGDGEDREGQEGRRGGGASSGAATSPAAMLQGEGEEGAEVEVKAEITEEGNRRRRRRKKTNRRRRRTATTTTVTTLATTSATTVTTPAADEEGRREGQGEGGQGEEKEAEGGAGSDNATTFCDGLFGCITGTRNVFVVDKSISTRRAPAPPQPQVVMLRAGARCVNHLWLGHSRSGPQDCLLQASSNSRCTDVIMWAAGGDRRCGCSTDTTCRTKAKYVTNRVVNIYLEAKVVLLKEGVRCDNHIWLGYSHSGPQECLAQASADANCKDVIMWASDKRCGCSRDTNCRTKAEYITDPHCNIYRESAKVVLIRKGAICVKHLWLGHSHSGPQDCLRQAISDARCKDVVMWSTDKRCGCSTDTNCRTEAKYVNEPSCSLYRESASTTAAMNDQVVLVKRGVSCFEHLWLGYSQSGPQGCLHQTSSDAHCKDLIIWAAGGDKRCGCSIDTNCLTMKEYVTKPECNIYRHSSSTTSLIDDGDEALLDDGDAKVKLIRKGVRCVNHLWLGHSHSGPEKCLWQARSNGRCKDVVMWAARTDKRCGCSTDTHCRKNAAYVTDQNVNIYRPTKIAMDELAAKVVSVREGARCLNHLWLGYSHSGPEECLSQATANGRCKDVIMWAAGGDNRCGCSTDTHCRTRSRYVGERNVNLYCRYPCHKAAITDEDDAKVYRMKPDSGNNGKNCADEGTDRIFDLRGSNATEIACIEKCIADSSCVAFSAIFGSWCIGCQSLLAAAGKNAVAYRKKQASPDDVTIDHMESVLKQMPQNHRFDVIMYDKVPRALFGSPVLATAAHKDAALREIKNKKPRSGSNAYQALEMAYGEDLDQMYFMSDGRAEGNSCDDILAKEPEWDKGRKVPINAIWMDMKKRIESTGRFKRLKEIFGPHAKKILGLEQDEAAAPNYFKVDLIRKGVRCINHLWLGYSHSGPQECLRQASSEKRCKDVIIWAVDSDNRCGCSTDATCHTQKRYVADTNCNIYRERAQVALIRKGVRCVNHLWLGYSHSGPQGCVRQTSSDARCKDVIMWTTSDKRCGCSTDTDCRTKYVTEPTSNIYQKSSSTNAVMDDQAVAALQKVVVTAAAVKSEDVALKSENTPLRGDAADALDNIKEKAAKGLDKIKRMSCRPRKWMKSLANYTKSGKFIHFFSK